jgi:hypothetical protein
MTAPVGMIILIVVLQLIIPSPKNVPLLRQKCTGMRKKLPDRPVLSKRLLSSIIQVELFSALRALIFRTAVPSLFGDSFATMYPRFLDHLEEVFFEFEGNFEVGKQAGRQVGT